MGTALSLVEAFLSQEWENQVMASKYDSETKERVVRLYRDRRSEAPEESKSASYRRLHELVGIPIDTMRTWVTRAEIDGGTRPGITSAENEEIRRLRKENAELKRANEILKTASAFFAAAELDRRLK
jgi:transposase-like protein